MWLFVAISSYFLNAGVYVADKFLLSRKIHSSIVYAFYVGIWSIGNFVLLFFDPWVPRPTILLLDLLAGFIFLCTLVFWYKALHQSEATRVVPIVGALTPVFSFLFSFIFLGAKLEPQSLAAFIVLIAGGLLISIKKTRLHIIGEVFGRVKEVVGNTVGRVAAEARPTRRLLINSLMSAVFFAAYYVFIKYIYSHTGQPFIAAFAWSRLGSFLGVLAILFVPSWRRLINESKTHENRTPKQLAFFFLVRLGAAAAFIMLNWAVSLGDNVSMINALQGTQYVFLLILVLVLAKKYPGVLDEELGKGVVMQKVLGIILVMLGLYLLVA
ncbi:MAG: EamA family transporter [Candidatus Falkowbacteria bacterium]|nr:EamA family transporter [Candidatus Falkowbacteria bacterium]